MPSQIEIANYGITKIGGTRIASFDDDTTEGRAVKATYDMSRKSAIRRALWNFAKRRVTVPASADAPAWGFSKKYPMPIEFVRLLQVNDYTIPLGFNAGRTEDDQPYAYEENCILTDFAAPLKVRGLVDITDPTKYDAIFVQVYACQIGYDICETVTGSSAKKNDMLREMAGWIREGIKANQVENPAEVPHDGSWLLSRY